MKVNPEYSSRFRILKGGKISLVVSALLGSVTLSFAAPSGGVVTSGSATINQSGKITNINQSTQKASINWQKFSVASDETVNFNQPNVNSITLNRVVGNERSVINGALNANGQVWILNSNGVLFGKNASINTAGLLATTKELSDQDFNTGNYNFKGSSTESVINLGEIDISNSGYAILLANSVSNEGTIKAVKGSVRLIGANEVTINLNGNSILDLTVNKGVLDALVENKGAIYADGGQVYLTTNAVNELLKGLVNNTGIIEANSLDGVTGYVELFAHGGEVQVGGTITAKDGFVETSGKDFTVDKNTNIKAKTWLIDPLNLTVDDATAYETALGNGTDTLIQTDNATGSDEGNIYINDTIDWTTTAKLTLDAYNNIYINKAISATAGQLALYYGDAGDYYVNAQVNLSAGDNFFTKKASDGAETIWTVVTTANALESMSLSGNTVLGADVDASGIANWNPIGDNTNKFTGTFDGLGHTVDNLTIDRSYTNIDSYLFLGLFGYTDNGSIIQNIGVTNVDIKGAVTVNVSGTSTFSNLFVGSLAGYNKGTISNSYTTGKVFGKVDSSNVYTGINYSGGLVGANTGIIENSYTTTDVEVETLQIAKNYSGGLVGSNFGTIENSYASNTLTVAASSDSSVGGLVGSSSSFSGATTNNSYYNKTKNTGIMSDSSLGKSTTDLKNLATFSDWDIESYTSNENTFPTLSWQYDASKGYTKKWVIGQKASSGGGTTPIPTPTPSQNEVEKVVTAIVNQNVLTINPPRVETPNNAGQNVSVNFNVGGNQTLISQPIQGQNTQRISLSEARQMQQENGVNSQEVRVPLSRSSMIELVDGGVNLPLGIEQEFYVAQDL